MGSNVVPLALAWWLAASESDDETPSAIRQLWTDASASIDALRVFCGEVSRVRAITPMAGVSGSVAGVTDPGGKVPAATEPSKQLPAHARGLVLQLEFASGTVGMLTCATFARPEPRIELELLGETWSLRFGRDLESLRLDERDKTTILRCLSNPAVRQTTAFLDAVTQRNPALASVSYADALRTMAVCHAAELSVRENRTVELEEVKSKK